MPEKWRGQKSDYLKVIADLHVHSRFAMACSASITIKSIGEMADKKGIGIISTGDFTNPYWLKEIKENLAEENGSGLYALKDSDAKARFVLGAEICTSSQNKGKNVRIHHCVLMSSIEKVEAFNEVLAKHGDLAADGRAVVSMSPDELAEEAFKADKNAFVFPAHVWTPWFGALGAMSGYNSIKEVYRDMEKDIYAIETGLSSDPPMNWRLSELDKYALISNSDMHSLNKMGREANLFNLNEMSYAEMTRAIKEKSNGKLNMTFEFYPEEGKYHYDGHRQCNYSVNPSKKETICPVCGKRLVAGVLHRIEDLADREEGVMPSGAKPYMHLIPLIEIIGKVLNKSEYSPYVLNLYNKFIEELGNEFEILTEMPLERISGISDDVATAICKLRNNKVNVVPGYDGKYGIIEFGEPEEKEDAKRNRQTTLSGF